MDVLQMYYIKGLLHGVFGVLIGIASAVITLRLLPGV